MATIPFPAGHRLQRGLARFFCHLCLFLVIGSPAWADSPSAPYPHIVTSPKGKAYFVMLPAPLTKASKAHGKAYVLNRQGEPVEQWSVTGWYSDNLLITDDGDCLVRIEGFPNGEGPKKGDVAITFYNKGKAIKSYDVAYLVEDPAFVISTASHYVWLAQDDTATLTDHTLRIKTMDRITYFFDVTTGSIVQSRQER